MYTEDNFANDPADAADVEGLKRRTVQNERLDLDSLKYIAFRLKPHECGDY